MFELLVNIYECLLIAWTSYSLSHKKENQTLVRTAFFCYAGTIFLFITYINTFSMTESLYTIIDLALAYLYVSVISTDRPGRKLLVCYLATNIIGIWNTLQNITASYLLYQRFDIPLMMEEHRLPLLILAQIMHTVILVSIVYLLKKHPFNITDKDSFLLALALYVCNFMTICFESVGMHFENQDLYMVIGIYMVMLFVVLIVYLFYSVHQHSLNESKQRLELEILHRQQSSNEKIIKAQHDLQQLRHDMKHFVRLLKEVEESSDQERLHEIIDQYDQANKNELVPIKTPSPALDYVINIKRDDAISKGIDFVVSINLTHPIKMEDDDLYLLLANLLDNSIEHIGIKKRIYVEIYDVKQMLMIRVTNSIDIHVLDHDGKIITQSHGEQHGYGIKTIETVLEKYDGFFSYMEKEDNFIATVMLPLSVIDPQ